MLKDAYEESKKLFEIKIPSWYGSITLLIKNIRGLKELSNVSKHKFKYSDKDVIYQVYKENWGKQILNIQKVNYVATANSKHTLDLKKYLCILKSFEQRRNFTRFRISSHRLQIERGRYQGALRQDRLCLRCTSGEIDDEKHFLISCSTCPVIRTEMFSRINNICQNFHVLNPEQKLYWLLNNENEEILASICNLIKQSTI